MFSDGANIFDNDLEAMHRAVKGIGVLSGWTVTPASGMTVTVALGVGYIGTAKKETVAGTNLTVPTADPYNPRRDIIIWDASSGVLAIVAGTPDEVYPAGETAPLNMQAPAPPNLETDDILIAEIYVAAATTIITAGNIFDKRHLLSLSKTAITDHEAASDPHTGYQKESEKGNANGYEGLDGSSKMNGAHQVYGTGSDTACQGNDARLSDARTPTAHATSHQNGGGDEIATATPAANVIPKAGAGGALALGFIPATLTGKDADTLDTKHYSDISGDISGAITTHCGASDPHTGYQKESEKDAASGYAGLDGSSKLASSQIPTDVMRWKGVLASAPGSPVAGWVYKNSGDSKYYIYNGTDWDALT